MFAFYVPGPDEIVVLLMTLALIVGTIVVAVLPLWCICTKAGFPGWYSLVGLIPVLSVVLLFYLALADWPAIPSAARNEWESST